MVNKVVRADGTTVKIDKEEAEQADITAQAKRVLLVDSTGTIIPSNFNLEIARGNISGMKMFGIPGRKDSVSQTVLDDITQVPNTTVLPNPGGIQLEVVSSSIQDDNDTGGGSPGTGILSVDIHYLDSSGDEQEEIVIMNGTAPVDTVGTDFAKIQWMHAKTVGTNTVAVGNISLRSTDGSVTYEYILAEGNQSLSGRYHIPTGKVGYILGWQASAITKKIDIRLRATCERFDRSLISEVFLFQDALVLKDGSSGWLPFDVPLKIPARATVKMSAISVASGGDVGSQFDILLIDD